MTWVLECDMGDGRYVSWVLRGDIGVEMCHGCRDVSWVLRCVMGVEM